MSHAALAATRPPRAVLFDLDGTLADTAPDLAGALNRMRTARGLPVLPLEALRPMASAGARGLLKAGLALEPGQEGYEEGRLEFLQQYASHIVSQSCLFEGVRSLLDHVSARSTPWGIVTNKHAQFAHPVIHSLGLQDAAVVICGDTTPHAKPHPEPLLVACQRLGIRPEQAWYVGDDVRDALAAQAAGMPFIAVSYGYLGCAQPIESWGANAIAHSPQDVWRFIGD